MATIVEDVTHGQLEEVKRMAKAAGVGKDLFQTEFLDNGALASLFRRVGEKSVKPPLLTEIDTVELPSVERFVAADAFGPNNPDGIRFFLGDNFKKLFFGKTEANVHAATLAIHRLNRKSVDEPIRRELTPSREETALAHFYELIKRQPRGERGKLPTDGTLIIAYIYDVNEIGGDNGKGTLWAVGADWNSFSAGWSVNALSVEDPFPWLQGRRVLSRK
ncbi:MAG: hypothetical protein G01um101430_696 [Parcubacteria group bacterium Gr01-1014_30]|nr:MAG: hypothetical protein G01um101430_696 [Parcubacteria group bacterium Gr01-1014_30]